MSERELFYEPRDIFIPYHNRRQRWAAMVAHRRAGKTVATLGDISHRAQFCDLHRPQYGYIAPQYNQAKRIAWNYLKDITRAIVQKQPSESNLSVELYNGATISLFGADNPDSFRGLYFDGLVLDEYGNMPPSVWSTILRPTLIDRKGWATFIGTPNGPNHFRDLWLRALKNSTRYFTAMHKVTETGLISASELAEMREEMTEEEYEQEMLCSFEAATRGAFFGADCAAAEAEARVKDFDVDPTQLNFVFDLGYRDDTTIWCWQNKPDGYALVHSEANNTKPIKYYIDRIHSICSNLGVARGEVWLPHDARAKSLQTGRSIVEQFVSAGIRPQIVPNLDLLDGISAARLIFKDCIFHRTGTGDGFLALKSYHREFDELKKHFKESPVHDWSSHYADGFRYFAIVARKVKQKAKVAPFTGLQQKTPSLGSFTMDQLWASRKQRTPHGRI
jgi:phage terminase large subunit